MRQVAANIRRARREHGHTQASLAVALGVDTSTVQRWEGGAAGQPLNYPWRRHLELLSKVLGHDPGWFYTSHPEDQDDEGEALAA